MTVSKKQSVILLSLFFSALWFVVFLFGGLFATAGRLSAAGGGATIFGLFPAALFFGTTFYFKKRSEELAFFSSIVFFVSVFLGIVFLWVTVPGAEHWPFWFLAVYLILSVISLVQAIGLMVFQAVAKRKSSR